MKTNIKFRNISINFNLCKFILFAVSSVLLGTNIYAENQDSSTTNHFKIAIFKEEEFPSVGTPVSLTPEWLYNNLSRDFSVTYLNSAELGDKKYLNSDTLDLLILPYGEAFPYEAFRHIKKYVFEGGGLFNIAGRPFWAPMAKIDGKWQKLNITDPYKEFLSPLGIKYYEFLDNDNIGLSVTTSLGFNPIQPTHGNVFPYRIPARDFYSLDRPPIVFVKSWRNPYIKDSKNIPKKWCLIGAKGESNLLNPRDPFAHETLLKIIDYLSSPITIYGLETDLAAYYQKERVKVSLEVINSGRNKEECTVELELLDKTGEIVYEKSRSIELKAGQRTTLNAIWHPKRFESDFYKVIAILKKEGKIYDKEENGFVVINKDILKSGPSLQIKGNKFFIDGKISYIFGINYYENKLGELMWLRPNIFRIREDFKSMRALGINFIRIHYHHSKWFRDYISQVVKKELDPYLQIADTTALPSKRSLRILDAIIQLAQEQGLVFSMDIFSLVPEDMGNPIGWLGMKERILDKDKISVQKKFVQLLALRYKDVLGITWDLWNEPRLDKTDYQSLRNWIREVKEVFRENGDNHPVTIGDDLSLYLLDVLDYACLHTYEPGDFSFLKNLSKPFIFQEAWNEAGCSLNDEIKQAEELKKDFNAFLKTEAAGFVPWQWTRQARLWNNASDAERWDDELGVCVHDDGTLKVAGGVYKSLISLAK